MRALNNNLNVGLISRLAFTLAEVLIVLGIVGTIAELTIPTLISDFQDKAAVVGLKSEASNLQQAISLAVVNEGNIEDWYSGTTPRDATKAVAVMLSKYLKGQNCDVEATSICTSSDAYKKFNPSLPTFTFDTTVTYSEIVLLDGSILYFYVNYNGTDFMDIIFIIDVNGLKGPNRIAYDVFSFTVYSAQFANANNLKSQVLIPSGNVSGAISGSCDSTRSGTGGIGWSCTSWAYFNGNRDYIHCRSVLNWDTKTTCD